jgi:hypothetical protein
MSGRKNIRTAKPTVAAAGIRTGNVSPMTAKKPVSSGGISRPRKAYRTFSP